MILLLLHLLRLLPFLFGGHRHFALENLALRHQLAVSDGRRSRRSSARSSRFPKSVACIIATSAGRRSPTPVSLHRHQRALPCSLLSRRSPSSAENLVSPGKRDSQKMPTTQPSTRLQRLEPVR